MSRRQLLAVSAACLLTLSACVAGPRSDADAIGAADTLRILSYNIRHGEGMDSIVDLDRVSALILRYEPDLVALQEVDSVTERTGRVDQASELGRLTGLHAEFGSFMPYQGGAYGMAVLSRRPVGRVENIRLPDGVEPRSSLAVDVLLPRTGVPLRFVGVHFYRTAEERLAQALSLEGQLSTSESLTILGGDFNSLPDSEVMAHLRSTWSVVDKGEDSFTFPSDAPAREIDYFVLPPTDRVVLLREQVIDEPLISDHRPLLIEVVVRE